MKKLIVLFALCVFGVSAVSAQIRSGNIMFITARNLELRASTGFFAKTSATIQYGTEVDVMRVNGDWVEVRSRENASVAGWTRSANLTSRRIVPGRSGGATAQEVALAGKGFNQDVEDVYRQGDHLDYDAVDRVEAHTVNREDLHSFLVEGRLSLGAQ
jgi:hypothetical protein